MAVFSVEQLQAVQFFSALTTDDCEQLLDRHLESSHAAEQVFVMEQDWGESVFSVVLRHGQSPQLYG